MRVLVLWLLVGILICYGMKDWFKPVPFLILLMPIYGHPDMPSGAFGIQGLNPWNVLLLGTFLGYILQKGQEGLSWDMSYVSTSLLIVYVCIIIISTLRLVFDLETLRHYGADESFGTILSEQLINTLKFFAPGYLVFVGARTKYRRKLILWAIIISYLYIAQVVIRGIPVSAVTDDKLLTQVGLKVLEKTFSWSKVNTAMLLGGGAWAILFCTPYLLGKWYTVSSIFSVTLFGLTSFALGLTGGRMGYIVWVVLGLLFSFYRWKKGLIILPILILIVLSVVPSITGRIMQGLSPDSEELSVVDSNKATSGRTEAWPVVIDRIGRSPVIGYGALAMVRTGASEEVAEILEIPEGDRGFPHPHNAYLFLLLDTGIVGAIPVLLFWCIVLYRSQCLCGDNGSESDAIGVTSLTSSLALLIAGLGSQTFYPVHGSIAMWAAIALAFRLYEDRYYMAA